MQNIIEVSHLNKSYGEIKAVNDLSFKVKRGELFAFLGVNGAGKSTTISIICNTLQRDSGTVTIDGLDVDLHEQTVKTKLGVVFQNCVLDLPLSVKQNLESRASLYGIHGKDFERRYAELSEIFGLHELSGRAVGKLSGGQRRRVDIARALIHNPEILIMDEPTTGLDPQTRKSVWEIVEKLRKERGMTVFLTTHYMEEAADADFVVILDGGVIAAEGTPLDLKNKYTGDYITVYNPDEIGFQKLGVDYVKIGKAIRILVKDTAAAKQMILERSELFNDFEIVKGKMDDVFLAVTGKNLSTGIGDEK